MFLRGVLLVGVGALGVKLGGNVLPTISYPIAVPAQYSGESPETLGVLDRAGCLGARTVLPCQAVRPLVTVTAT